MSLPLSTAAQAAAAGAVVAAAAGAAPAEAAPGPAGAAEQQPRHDSGAAAVAAAAPSLAHPDGISLAGLRAFVAEHGGEAGLAGMTTSKVKRAFVMPETKAAACSYANLLRARSGADAAHVGRANAFISHVYSECFLDMHNAVAVWEERQPAGEPPVFYYFDLLVVNQHGQSAAVASDVLWREFTGSVRAIGRTLVVLTLDAAKKGPLTRVWCVAEIAAGLQDVGAGGSRAGTLEVIMTPGERARFVKDLTRDFDKIAQRTCTVDLERAHAWHGDECLENGKCRDVAEGHVAACSNDLPLVLAHLRREISFADINQRVIARMREFMVAEARAVLDAMPSADARADSLLQFFLARLLKDCGRLVEAEALLRVQAEVCRRMHGDSSWTLAVINLHANVLMGQDELGEAEKLFRESLAARQRAHGDVHVHTLGSMHNLGILLHARGDLAGAEPLLRGARDARLRELGKADPSTLTSLNALGTLLLDLGDLDGAENLLREALNEQRRTLGDAHQDTLISMNILGRLLVERGGALFAEAEVLSRNALAGRKRTLGNAHAQTLISLRDTANLLVSLGGADNLAEAALLDAEALAGLRRTLGEAHRDTLKAKRVHGRVLAAQGDLTGAVAALRASLDGFRAKNAVEARKSARELAAVLRAQGDMAGAAEAEAEFA